MSHPENPHDPRNDETGRLLKFTRLLGAFSAAFALAELLLAWLVQSTRILGTGLLMLLFTLVVLLARRWVRCGKEEAAVELILAGLLIVTLLSEALVPFATTTLAIVPVIAFTMVLPWLSGRHLRRAAMLCLVTELALALFAYSLPRETANAWQRALGAASLVAAVVLVLMLLLQHGERQAESIAALRDAHRSLRIREDLYRRMVDAAAEGIWRGDAASRTSFVNNRMAALLGRAPEDLLHQSVFDHVVAESLPKAQALVNKHEQGLTVREELSLRRQDGSPLRVSLGAVPVHDDDGRYAGFLWLVTDVTELAHLQSQLMSAERLASIGNLAAGVAHDFNNLLTVVMGHAQLLARELGAETPAAAHANKISQVVTRAAELTSHLLAFGRKQVLHPEVLSLNELVRALTELMRSLLGEQIALALDLAPELGDVYADQGQLERVLVNLVMNARDAMPQGGRLELRSERIEVQLGDACADGSLPPGSYSALSISDTGCGMDEQTRSHLFEPFFTTKPIGMGTGLGLATSYGIVKQSGGHITVRSAPGQGSTFKIYLPHTVARRAETAPRAEARTGTRAQVTILLVEDNADLREVVTQVLRLSGYEVLRATDGEEALDVCARRLGPIHLLLTDVVMPGLGGVELSRRLREQRPTLSVVYMSGHPAGELGPLGQVVGARNFLHKPFTIEALLAKVSDNLASVLVEAAR